MTTIHAEKPLLDREGKINFATEVAFSSLINEAAKLGLKLVTRVQLMYVDTQSVTQQFRSACRCVIEDLEKSYNEALASGVPVAVLDVQNPREKELKQAAHETNEALKQPLQTFHNDDAIEIRCTILCDGKRLDVHVIDLEGVVAAAQKQNVALPWVDEFLDDMIKLVAKNEDGHKLEITPQNLTGSAKERKPFPPGVAAATPVEAAGPPAIERDQR